MFMPLFQTLTCTFMGAEADFLEVNVKVLTS